MPGMKKTMGEFKAGTLHSGSKSGPVVKSQAQAIAIGMSEKSKGKGYASGGTVRGGGMATRGKKYTHC